MSQIVEIMLPPLAACLILTGIHTYLGLHVVSRGVIFVDLALAQIAALGTTFGFLLGHDPKSTAGYFYSLSFAFVGAAIFSLSRLRDNRVPQEALIGITFAVASSATILIADRAPQGAEHVEEMLTGAILWIDWATIGKTLLIYSGVGLFHWIFREKFLLISMNHERAEELGINVRWWDFLFYLSFGFVITSSVAIGGVLLVFSFLIIPSVIAMLFARAILSRLLIGWVSGVLASLLGLYISYRFDFPSGPSVVCSFGLFLVAAGVAGYIYRSAERGAALRRVAVGTACVILFFFVATRFRPGGGAGDSYDSSSLQLVQDAVRALEAGENTEVTLNVLTDNLDVLVRGIRTGSIELSQLAIQNLGKSEAAQLLPALEALTVSTDPWRSYYQAEAMLQLGEKEGIHRMIELLRNPDAPIFLRSQIIGQLQELIGDRYGYDPALSPEDNIPAIDSFEVWWHQNLGELTWNSERQTFELRAKSNPGPPR